MIMAKKSFMHEIHFLLKFVNIVRVFFLTWWSPIMEICLIITGINLFIFFMFSYHIQKVLKVKCEFVSPIIPFAMIHWNYRRQRLPRI